MGIQMNVIQALHCSEGTLTFQCDFQYAYCGMCYRGSISFVFSFSTAAMNKMLQYLPRWFMEHSAGGPPLQAWWVGLSLHKVNISTTYIIYK